MSKEGGAIALAIFSFFIVGFGAVRADTYPQQVIGIWGGRAEHDGDDNPAAAIKACNSYTKDPKAVVGDVLIFRGSEKLSFGGYADYIDKNISVKQIGPDNWQITDRHYQDEEGGKRAGYRMVNYTVSLSGDIMTMKEGKYVSRFSKCVGSAALPK
jgi:hypothetical protein